MVDDDRRWREVVKAMDRAQEGAATGVADGGDPAGEIATSREAAGESGAAAASTTAAVVAETREGMGRVSGVVGGGCRLRQLDDDHCLAVLWTCGVWQHRVFNAPPISRKFTYYSYAKRTIFRAWVFFLVSQNCFLYPGIKHNRVDMSHWFPKL